MTDEEQAAVKQAFNVQLSGMKVVNIAGRHLLENESGELFFLDGKTPYTIGETVK